MIEVAGVLRVHRARMLRLAVHQRAAVVGREQPLVRVDDETVGLLDAVEQVSHRGGGETGTAVGTVDVHPHPEFTSDGCHIGEVIDEPLVGRSGRDNHGENVRVGFEHGTQRRPGEVPSVVNRYLDDLDVECLRG